MATKKYLTKYARGSKQTPKLVDGLRAMQIQSQTQTQALQNLKTEQAKQDAQYSSGLDRAGKVAEANRKLKQQIEVEIPEKLQQNALKRNNITQQNNFKVKIKEQQELAKAWGKLSPTLAANAEKAIGNAIDYFQTEAGIAEYESELADGTVGSINKFRYNRAIRQLEESEAVLRDVADDTNVNPVRQDVDESGTPNAATDEYVFHGTNLRSQGVEYIETGRFTTERDFIDTNGDLVLRGSGDQLVGDRLYGVSLADTYDLDAGSSPTNMTPNPGMIPLLFKSLILCFNSFRISADIDFPSINFALIRFLLNA